MKCVHCGAEGTEGAKYCSQCGRIMALPAPPSVVPAQPVITPPLMSVPPTPIPMASQATPIMPTPVASPVGVVVPPQKKKSGLKKWLLILAGIIILPFVAIAAAGVFASIFEAAVTRGEEGAQTNNAPLEVSAGYYQSPNGRFVVNFPGVSPERVEVIPRSEPATNVITYLADLEGSTIGIIESDMQSAVATADTQKILNAWLETMEKGQGGQIVASEFGTSGGYPSLDFAMRSPASDIVGRAMLIDPYTMYVLMYSFQPGKEDYAVYDAFVTSFTYTGEVRAN